MCACHFDIRKTEYTYRSQDYTSLLNPEGCNVNSGDFQGKDVYIPQIELLQIQ